MIHYPFLSPLFGCSRGNVPPPAIIPKRDEYLLSRRNPAHFSQYQPFLLNFGITKTSGYDPPWTFKTYSEKGKEGKSAECHYPCMTIEDIYDLPVNKLAAEDCVLFLWVTFPLLREGLTTIRKWGFEYKTCGFNWVKRNKKSDTWFWGLGYWTRSNSELCLLATKGHPPSYEQIGPSNMRRESHAA